MEPCSPPASSPPLSITGSSPESSVKQPSKPKKKSTITPRSFKRFFAPRTSLERGKKVIAGRHALTDITNTGANRYTRVKKRHSSERRTTQGLDELENHCLRLNNSKERKRLFCTPDTTPERPSPLKRLKSQGGCGSPSFRQVLPSADNESVGDFDSQLSHLPRPVVMSEARGRLRAMLRRETSQTAPLSSGLIAGYCPDWRSETADFYSAPEDVHSCRNVVAEHPAHALPFCSTACNTNSLVAIGDEEGGIRLLESEKDGKPAFNKTYLTFRPHNNAILDITFSSDDLLMATASGDQTAQIIDMPTQRTTHTLAGHVSSVKQIRFQPESNSKVIATSSRDGSIQLWDLRCKGIERPVSEIKAILGGTVSSSATSVSSTFKMTYASCVNMIQGAHDCSAGVFESLDIASGIFGSSKRQPKRGHERSEVSITSLSFLPHSNPYLLLSGSEAHATVRLWDLRMNQSRRQRKAIPVCTTRQPDSHGTHRQFGLTSLVLSGDGARLFTLCKDNTVYAYSTSHLVLGTSPELEHGSLVKPRRGLVEKEGLGPIYGFRHAKLKASTFYVKLALRPAQGSKSEMLAVGSTDSCAVLFPTNEQYLHHSKTRTKSLLPSSTPQPPALGLGAEWSPSERSSSFDPQKPRLHDTIPIYDHGLALVRGHDKEVTSISWSCDGELITVGDDRRCRVWREDGQRARELRTIGEASGNRWCHGWAELGIGNDDWDQDD